MRAATVAIAVCLALAWTALPAAFPALEEVSVAGAADARPPCVIGPDDCIIPMYCVTEPCPSWP
jgi:hypothetical protein